MTDVKTILQSELTVNKLKINNVNYSNQFTLTGQDGFLYNTSSLSLDNNNNLKLLPSGNILLDKDVVLENQTLYFDIDKSTYLNVNNIETINNIPTPILILNTTSNSTYLISFEITANNKIDGKYSVFTAYLNVIQNQIDTNPMTSDFINYIITSDPEMEDTNITTSVQNNTFKLMVNGLSQKQIYWKSSVKISSNSGNSNIINNGSGYVKIESTDIVSTTNDFRINYNNDTNAKLILNVLNQQPLKKILMYNNSENTSLIELYDPINNKGQILLNNTNILDYTTSNIKSYKELDINNNKIVNLATPTNDNDATTKLYVDSKIIKYSLITQNTTITQALTTTSTNINTSNGSYLTNNFINSTYSIDTIDGSIKINETGYYDITITFDYLLDVYNILTLSFGINNTTVLRKITNNESNKYNTIQLNTIVNVSILPYNFSLYIKRLESITSNITIENLSFKILKLG